jgi:ABC-2 type transport system permease protein
MIFELTHRELRGKYKGSLLGFLWTYINPLCQIIVYAFVFSQIFRSGIEVFYIYIIVSMFPWNFFTGGVIQGLGSIRYQGDLVKKVYFPRQILPLVSITVNLVNMIISFIIIYSIILASGWGIDWWLQPYLIIVIFIEYIFTLGLALALSAVEVYFRDIEHITSVILMIWMYMTPMFYSLDSIPEQFQTAFHMNPMLYIIGMYQQVLYYKVVPTIEYITKGAGAAGVSLVIGWIVFGLSEKRFAEEL